jgi:Glyoxalase-like domain
MTVRWVTAFLDTAEESAEAAETFWSRVSGHHLSTPRGERDEFASLLPPAGDPHLAVQRVVRSAPGGLHLDLHADDVRALAAHAESLGASASYLDAGYVVCGSPGGMTFCVVPHPGGRRAPAATWPGGRSAVDQVCLDIPPTHWVDECAFWAGLTGWELTDEHPDDEFRRIDPPSTIALRLLLQRLDDEQPVVTGHLDLACDDMTAEAARHVALGARQLHGGRGWITLADPTGRVYCVTRRVPA